ADNVGVTRILWANSRGGSGTATGGVNWSASAIPLSAGTNVLTITAYDAAGNASSASLTAVSNAPAAPTATALAIMRQPSPTATSGLPFAQQPVIQLRDAVGNAVSQAGVTVSAQISASAGTLGGTVSAPTDASGSATFSNLSITGSGRYVLTFSAAGKNS